MVRHEANREIRVFGYNIEQCQRIKRIVGYSVDPTLRYNGRTRDMKLFPEIFPQKLRRRMNTAENVFFFWTLGFCAVYRGG